MDAVGRVPVGDEGLGNGRTNRTDRRDHILGELRVSSKNGKHVGDVLRYYNASHPKSRSAKGRGHFRTGSHTDAEFSIKTSTSIMRARRSIWR